MDEDLPYENNPPSAVQADVILYKPDPDLCLTPDVWKSVDPKLKTRKVRFKDVRQSLEFDSDDGKCNDRVRTSTDCKIRHKNVVICDKEYVADRYMNTDDYCLDYSICNINKDSNDHISKTHKYVVYDIEDRNVDNSSFIDKHSFPTVPAVENHPNVTHEGMEIFVDRDGCSRRTKTDYSYPFSETAIDVSMDYSVFSKPEYNSTLRIGEEIKELKSTKPDVVRALTDKLKTSETLRMVIGEKAASRVNQSSFPIFTDLVSVDTSEVKVIKQAEREKQKKPPRSVPQTTSKFPEPDIMAFFSDDLQRDSVDLSLNSLGVLIPETGLMSADLTSAHDVYLHNKLWDGC